jgi:hypothetical protein
MGLHKNTTPPKKRLPRKLKRKEFELAKRNPTRTSRTSNNLESDAASRVNVAFEDAASRDASRADTSRLGATGLGANSRLGATGHGAATTTTATTTEENPAPTILLK